MEIEMLQTAGKVRLSMRIDTEWWAKCQSIVSKEYTTEDRRQQTTVT
jgi:hypothetical protein